jgi:hypothetical protein
MELDTQLLLLYFALWGIFYFYLVKVIADRSVQKWIDRFDQDVTPEGGELLVHLLKPVLQEIFEDNEQLLKDFKDSSQVALKEFKDSLFSKVARQVREVKAISKNFNPAGAALSELTEDNPILGLILSHVNIPGLNAITTQNNEELTEVNPKVTISNDDYGL